MKTELNRNRQWLTQNKPCLEYSDTEIKTLDLGEALLISEPKIRFAVPIKIIHYPTYLDERGEADYGLPDSKPLSDIEERLRNIRKTGEKCHRRRKSLKSKHISMPWFLLFS